jgi:hypothetical protein
MTLSIVLSHIIIILLILTAILFWYFNAYESNIILLSDEIHNRTYLDPIIEELSKFETEMNCSYSSGNKTFYIRHPQGWDYFNFFANLGLKFKYAVYWEDGKIWATACAILRTIPESNYTPNGFGAETWYICDLKVHPSKRGQKIPYKMFCKGIFPAYMECACGYGITMLPPDALDESRTDRISHIAHEAGFDLAEILNIYMMTFNEFQLSISQNKQEWKKILGNWSFSSNMGKKDLYIDGKLTQLYHVVHVTNNLSLNNIKEDRDAYVMFCLPKKKCENIQIPIFACARILQHNMSEDQDWSFINTSEI